MSQSDKEPLPAPNPWTKFARRSAKILCGRDISRDDNKFILPGDEELIESMRDLDLTMPPLPFIGNPKTAKIWLLMLNPGSCESKADKVDYLGQDCLQEEDLARLRQRHRLLLASYRLGARTSFYPFDESFRRADEDCEGKKGGLYPWWRNVLLGQGENYFFQSEEECKANVFNVELSPYHSKDFKSVDLEKYRASPHTTYVSRLLEWGWAHEKIFVIRSPLKWIEMHRDFFSKVSGQEAGRIFSYSSTQSVRITTANVLPYYVHVEDRGKDKVYASTRNMVGRMRSEIGLGK